MRRLLALAAKMGVTVHGAHLSGEKIGCYVASKRRIYFDLSLTLPERRSVIAHEIAHAHYDHRGADPAQERLADSYAATLLVDPEWYAELEQISHDAEWIAEEMNVAPWIITDYRRYCLQRVGDATYASARMGTGQWSHRALVRA